jgi:hypothetical protein
MSLDSGKGEAFVDEYSGGVLLHPGTNASPLQLRLGLELRLGLKLPALSAENYGWK